MSEKKISVSVIVPMYKVERYIRKCISSIQNQTFKDLEIIIVNDGSPDRSLSIVKEMASKDHRLRIFDKKNGGLSSGRNYGLQNAEGKYIVFIDSDDHIEEDFIEDKYMLMEEENLDVCVSGVIIDFKEEDYQKIKKPENIFIGKDNKSISKIFKELEKKELFNFAWNKMYKKEVIKNNNIEFGLNDMPAEDLIFNSKVFQVATSVGIIDKAYYHYTRRDVETIVSTYSPNLYGKVEHFNYFRISLYEYY
ncbi:glycosyltransferase family 2 protein, partial [Rossellomorea marisflavi]|uniref:glycosyltransferase family 2 protein n=1 Tax=Rossellomorea marisflavi TaxID=189381 RepID=UPI00069EE03D